MTEEGTRERPQSAQPEANSAAQSSGAGENQLAQILSELARSLEAEDDTELMLNDLVVAAVAQIPGVDEGSISKVMARKDVVSQSPTSDLPRRVDALQSETGQGPCLDAVYQHRVVKVPDMASETRWPDFARRAAEAGAASMLSLQLWVEGDNLGALNLYGREPNTFTDESEEIGLLFVSHAAVAMASAQKQDGLIDGISARDLIGQAKGMLMERYKVDDAKAFALLVRVSQHANLKLRDVAAELISTGHLAATPKAPPGQRSRRS